jgi:RNA polymerase sigma-70 factor (ECF subfamily)
VRSSGPAAAGPLASALLLNPRFSPIKERSLMSEFGRLVEQEIPRLRRYARALTHDRERADDLVQNCLMRALANQHRWQPGTNLRAWLFTILHNTRVSDLRRSTREESCNELAMARMMPAPRAPDARLQLRDLERAIGELPESQRQVLLLIGLEEMSYDEVAAVLDRPVGTVRSRLSRARAALREQLAHLLPGNVAHRPSPGATTPRPTESTLAGA